MKINQNLAEVLNDLIQINNDRIEGYQAAMKEASDKDLDLKAVFSRMADESTQYVSELSHEVARLGLEPATIGSTSVAGKLYRAWMNVKATFSGHDRLALLESCEFGEDMAQKAYQQALSSDQTTSIDIRHIIARQKNALKISHDTIQRYRDLHRKSASDDLASYNSLRSSENDLRNEKSLAGN